MDFSNFTSDQLKAELERRQLDAVTYEQIEEFFRRIQMPRDVQYRGASLEVIKKLVALGRQSVNGDR